MTKGTLKELGAGAWVVAVIVILGPLAVAWAVIWGLLIAVGPYALAALEIHRMMGGVSP